MLLLSKITKQKVQQWCRPFFVWLVLSKKTNYTELRLLGQYQKKEKGLQKQTNINIKHQLISLRKLVKAAFFLEPQGMANLSLKKGS